MAILRVPTRIDQSAYRFTLELDEVVYRLLLIFNVRSNHWHLSLFDIDGAPLREGIKLVSNWPLTTTWTQQGRPDGELISANPENDADPERDTIGTDSVLVYDEGGAIG